MIKFKSENNETRSVDMNGYEAAIYNLAKINGFLELINQYNQINITTTSGIKLIYRILVEEAARIQKYIENHNGSK